MAKKSSPNNDKYTVHPRQVDRIYAGGYESYEDPADYIDVRAILKGRVIA